MAIGCFAVLSQLLSHHSTKDRVANTATCIRTAKVETMYPTIERVHNVYLSVNYSPGQIYWNNVRLYNFK